MHKVYNIYISGRKSLKSVLPVCHAECKCQNEVKRLPNPSTLAFASQPCYDSPWPWLRFFKENAADRSLSARGVSELLSNRSFGALHVSLGACISKMVGGQLFVPAEGLSSAHEGFTSFDPNLRGPMIKSTCSETLQGRSALQAFAKHADLMKSSDADIEQEAENTRADANFAAKVVITRGPDGATAHFRNKSGRVYAYARLKLRHQLLLDVLKKRMIEASTVVKAMRPWHLALVANGFARLQTSFLLELLGDEAFRRRGELEPQAIALLVNAHARLQMSNPLLFELWWQHVATR
eukprot:Skav223091  [mRNA]  locus=scaffold419:383662:392998:+ [translate_table: standard]